MMRVLLTTTDAELARYRAALTGEKLGWLVYQSAICYAPVHQIVVDPENGPVIIAGSEVLIVDDEATVYLTEEQAREAYWQRVQDAVEIVARAGEIRPEND